MNDVGATVFDISFYGIATGGARAERSYQVHNNTVSPGTSSYSVTALTSGGFIMIGALGVGIVGNLPRDPSGGTTEHLVLLGIFAPGQIGISLTHCSTAWTKRP